MQDELRYKQQCECIHVQIFACEKCYSHKDGGYISKPDASYAGQGKYPRDAPQDNEKRAVYD
ncbi:hypothetical protein JCM12107_00020 [Corynebacterium simulans]